MKGSRRTISNQASVVLRREVIQYIPGGESVWSNTVPIQQDLGTSRFDYKDSTKLSQL